MEEMGELATSFFKDLSKVYTNVQPQIILNIIEPQINQLIIDALCKEFIDEEISTPLFEIGPLKASVADGFPSCFF
jgi:hypothetical protein